MPKLPTFDWVKDPVPIRGFSQRVWRLANPAEVSTVIEGLRFFDLDPGQLITRTIDKPTQNRCPEITVRLDREANTTTGAANLQIQVNDVVLAKIHRAQSEGTTIAQVLVPAAVFRAAFNCHEHNVRTHLESRVRSALQASYKSPGFQHSVVGG